MSIQQFKLPDLGEGLTEGDILAWTVAVGDTVEVNDTIAEVETVKAAVELPSPFAGVVTALHAAAGETVPVGTAIISIDVGGADAPAAGTAADAAAPEVRIAEDLVPGLPGEGAGPVEEEKQMTLVGYGPREETGGRRRRRRPEATVAAAQTSFNIPPASVPHPAPEPEAVEPVPVPGGRHRGAMHRVLAKPPVRKLAKELGLDLATITPTGPHGTISREDVQAALAGGVLADGAPADGAPADGARADGARVDSAAPNGHLQPTTRAATDHPRETRIPIKGVRKHTAAAMVSSAFTAPHVTEFITVDITATMELRDRIAGRREFRDVKVSPLLLLSRAVLRALARTPELNATWDDAAQEIVLKHYVNLGIAAATGRGLIVPNIKDAHELPLLELARALAGLTETARAGRTTPAAMTGGTFTISNVGVFGVDTGTPILNPGESGILAFGAVRRTPWVVGTGTDERIEPRWVTQLAVSFDHRVVDGQQGSQFLADVAEILHDPGLALL